MHDRHQSISKGISRVAGSIQCMTDISRVAGCVQCMTAEVSGRADNV